MSQSLAQDAIALLIRMAERGELDPWDVKIIDVIDRFLTELKPTEAEGRDAYESSLSESGQAFLYASMLLLLKAESLAQSDQPEVDLTADLEGLEFFEDGSDFGNAPLPPFLERRLTRRAAARPMQRRRVTLKELIDQIQAIAASLEAGASRSPRKRPPKIPRAQAIKAIAALAHQENLSELAIALEDFLIQYWSTLSAAAEGFAGGLEFEALLDLWADGNPMKAQLEKEGHHSAVGRDRVGVFWALLLLSAQSKVELAQEEFYRDLRINLISTGENPDAVDFAAQVLVD